MKLKKLIVIGLLLLILSACGKNQSYKPEKINPEIDVCEVCNMSIAAELFATQMLMKDGDIYKFDDIGCMIEMIETDGSIEKNHIAKKYVRDVETGEWVELEDAYYVYHEDIWTPMAYGVVSFATKGRAEAFIDEQTIGELLNYEQLKEHRWGWE